MPHAVLLHATQLPPLGPRPLLQEDGLVFRVVEVARAPRGWLLKCLLVGRGTERRFFARVDERDDGLVVHLDDHVRVERDPPIFRFLALVARAVLDANPGARLGKTNLAPWMPPPARGLEDEDAARAGGT